MKRIKFIFKNGKVEVDAEGFKGKDCIKTTDEILSILNAEVKKRNLKPEYYREKVATREYEVNGL